VIVVVRIISQACRPLRASTSESSANGFWLASESIGSLLATREVATLILEFAHADSWELSGSVVLGFVLVNFMDRDGGVDNAWLDSLLVYDWLDGLVYVMVDVLTSNGRGGRLCVLGIVDCARILELGLLSGEALFDVGVVSVLQLTVLYTSNLMGVLFWEDFAILDRLDRCMVVILVYLTIDRRGDILVTGVVYMLVLNGRINSLVDCGIVLSILRKEASNCGLCFIHCN